MSNDFKGYSLFNEVKEPKLRAFNRIQTMVNLNDLFGEKSANEYVVKFTEGERLDMAIMAKWIKDKGMAEVQRTVRGE
jgi:hypothetical protein